MSPGHEGEKRGGEETPKEIVENVFLLKPSSFSSFATFQTFLEVIYSALKFEVRISKSETNPKPE
jgi:hypothetical protein